MLSILHSVHQRRPEKSALGVWPETNKHTLDTNFDFECSQGFSAGSTIFFTIGNERILQYLFLKTLNLTPSYLMRKVGCGR